MQKNITHYLPIAEQLLYMLHQVRGYLCCTSFRDIEVIGMILSYKFKDGFMSHRRSLSPRWLECTKKEKK